MRIAQLGTSDGGGGAANVAMSLLRGYATRGHRVRQFVGRRVSDDRDTVLIPDDRRWPYAVSGYATAQMTLRHLAGRYPGRGFGQISRTLRVATHPRAAAALLSGADDFDFPSSAEVVEGFEPDIIHAHNLHGGFFDLRALTHLSSKFPTVVTLHDMWLLTGHCAHALDCERWKHGCGQCPDLQREPAIRKDATAANWIQKQAIYAGSRLHIAVPSHWLRDQVRASMLAPHAASVRVIPNGVDTSIFHPSDRAAMKQRLDLPANASVVLLTASSAGSIWKDDGPLQEVIRLLAERGLPQPLVFVAAGRDGAMTLNAGSTLRVLPFQHDPRAMARIYQAADVYLHLSRADTFPLAVLEAMACGAAVAATRVGGIAEQIRSIDAESLRLNDAADRTGALVEPGDTSGMAEVIAALLSRDEFRRRIGANAAADVADRFTLDAQISAYLDWYADLLGDAHPRSRH